MQNRKMRIASWGLALLGSCSLGLLGTSCSSEGDGTPAERPPTVADFDLTSVPTNFAELEAAVAEWDRAYDVGRTHPAVLARKEELVKINDGLANMVESVEIEPGHVVKFYEPHPGARMVTETFLDNQKRALQGVALTSFADVYRALRPTATPPVALAEVDERAADTALQSAPPADLGQATTEQPAPEPESIDKHATSSCTHFKNSHGGCPAGSTGDTPFCRCNVGSVPQAAAAASTHSAWLVAPYLGGVSFRFTYSGTVQSTVPIVQGEHYGIQWTSGSGSGSHPSCNGCTWAGCNNYPYCVREHRGDVINVTTGEQYHFGGCLEYDYPTWECI
jgi:hypothetical protein